VGFCAGASGDALNESEGDDIGVAPSGRFVSGLVFEAGGGENGLVGDP
jgi:hypothetical protein